MCFCAFFIQKYVSAIKLKFEDYNFGIWGTIMRPVGDRTGALHPRFFFRFGQISPPENRPNWKKSPEMFEAKLNCPFSGEQ
jgi:hypothetical protein